uniref:Transcription factor Pcc1 n=1 Tax=Amphora coffeiformis TaxID=265554 RepID=A0A7S3P9B8_9STRA|mmetsp:Transcript_2561/g.5067  ORF Transcript_2561/g.5067 Transcript_2561/m.5067 type:complete len:103 (+) Transcript_2561:106-414(+)
MSNKDNDQATDAYPYACDVKIAFPTATTADIALKVMQVDEEIGNRVRKTLSIDAADPKCLNVAFEAIDAKSLRVSVSSFYDFLVVSLKCFQEFDEEGTTTGA